MLQYRLLRVFTFPLWGRGVYDLLRRLMQVIEFIWSRDLQSCEAMKRYFLSWQLSSSKYTSSKVRHVDNPSHLVSQITQGSNYCWMQGRPCSESCVGKVRISWLQQPWHVNTRQDQEQDQVESETEILVTRPWSFNHFHNACALHNCTWLMYLLSQPLRTLASVYCQSLRE